MDLSKAILEEEQMRIDYANDSLDAIDSMVPDMLAIVSKVSAMPGVDFGWVELNDFIGELEDAVDDLTAKRRGELMNITGYRAEPKSMYKRSGGVSEMLLDALKPLDPLRQLKNLENLRRKP